MTRILILLAGILSLVLALPSYAQPLGKPLATQKIATELTVLAYHEVDDPRQALIAEYAITPQLFEQHIIWLKQHGFQFVSVDQVLAAQAGQTSLPAKAILLSFDDGYQSFYNNAYPIIKKYQIPVVVALVGSWLTPDVGKTINFDGQAVARSRMLSWPELKEMNDSGLVEVASHTYALHNGILANPQGNLQPAVTARLYSTASGRYETDQAYHQRIYEDLKANNALFREHGLKLPRIMVWPYGRYNTEVSAIAAQLGMPMALTLDDGANLPSKPLSALHRILVDSSMTIADLAQEITTRQQHLTDNNRAQKIMHIDLDYIYDRDPVQQEKNLGLLLDRIVAMNVNTVYLQAFADPDGNGSANMVYFPNRHLPTRADLFNRAVWQIRTRTQVKRVYAWMPLLAWELPKDKAAAKDMVMTELHKNKAGLNMAYQRLSPFSAPARQTILEIYQDLAKSVPFDGILFHDDATLSDYEDASAPAKAQYVAWGLPENLASIRANEGLLQRWTALKTKTLDDFALSLAAEVRKQQPSLLTARNLYAQVALTAYAENWYSQSLENSLANYDFTAIMAMPYMEQVKDPDAFYNSLVNRVKKYPNGLKKVVFELQAKDWNSGKTIPSEELANTMVKLYVQGVRHVGYYPDNPYTNHPETNVIRRVFDSKSSETIP